MRSGLLGLPSRRLEGEYSGAKAGLLLNPRLSRGNEVFDPQRGFGFIAGDFEEYALQV